MTDPDARQQWDELLADLGFDPPATASSPPPPTAEVPLATPVEANTQPQVESSDTEEPSDAPPPEPEDAAAAKPRRRKTRTKTGKTKSAAGDTDEGEGAVDSDDGEAPAKPRRRKKRPAKAETEPADSEAIADSDTPEPLAAAKRTDIPSLPTADEGVEEVQPIIVDVPAVSVPEGMIQEVEVSEIVEITTGPGSLGSVDSPDTDEVEDSAADTPETDKKRKRRRRRGKGRGRDETIAPRTIEAGKGRKADGEALDDEPESEVVAETGGGPIAALDEDDEVDFIDLSDLQVPSWAELVASLYRPPDR
jgi:hypothetical protein